MLLQDVRRGAHWPGEGPALKKLHAGAIVGVTFLFRRLGIQPRTPELHGTLLDVARSTLEPREKAESQYGELQKL